MRGLMQAMPLTIGTLLPFAADTYANVEVVSRVRPDRTVRLTYGEMLPRVVRLADALLGLGVKPGEVITSLAFNTHRQFELFHACAMAGLVLHTGNPRLTPEQLAYTVNHAGSTVLLCDLDGLPIVEPLAGELGAIRHTVVLCDAAEMPARTALPQPISYETLLERGDPAARFPSVDEWDAACICYTSGTTGRPKGALYSHRGCILSSMTMVQPNAWSLGARDVVLGTAPLFHCNGWAVPFIGPMVGAKTVLPGRDIAPERLVELINSEGVTFTQGVPTVLLGVLEHLRTSGKRVDTLQRVVTGGSAPPLPLIEALQDEYGVTVMPSWGMTETTHGSTVAIPHPSVTPERRKEILGSIGRTLYGAGMRVVDDQGQPVPRDGKTPGHVQAKGHWVVAEYYKGEGGKILDDEGWLWTGDVGTIDADAYIRLTDRAKDVIKSGGEWISSIELENIVSAHPSVAEAAAIARPHQKWGERPVLAVVRRDGITADALLDWLRPKLPKWWMPDEVVFLPELPHTATGKVKKADLRALLNKNN